MPLQRRVKGVLAGSLAGKYWVLGGAQVKITATPEGGYDFNNWTGDQNSTDADTTFTMPSSPATVTATGVQSNNNYGGGYYGGGGLGPAGTFNPAFPTPTPTPAIEIPVEIEYNPPKTGDTRNLLFGCLLLVIPLAVAAGMYTARRMKQK